jgi:hypothetical protein
MIAVDKARISSQGGGVNISGGGAFEKVCLLCIWIPILAMHK